MAQHKVSVALTLDVTGQDEVDGLMTELVDQAHGRVDGVNVTVATLDVSVQFVTDHVNPRDLVAQLFSEARSAFAWPANKVRSMTVLDVEEITPEPTVMVPVVQVDRERILDDLRRATAAAEALLGS